jgi:hypothetical protein
MMDALEKKRYYFLLIRDMKLKSSNRKSGSWILLESHKFKRTLMDSDEFTIVFIGVHQDPNTLDPQFYSWRKQWDEADYYKKLNGK